MGDAEPSYIDYEAFLDPSFSAASFANTLVTATNNPTDTPLDLSTPLSRVLFDVQEIDTHIHTLTTKSALPLLEHTKTQTDASQHILKEVEAQVTSLTEGYARLEREVLHRWEAAEETRIAAERSWQVIRLGRAVGRCLTLGRQLEGQLAEIGGRGSQKEDHRALIRASTTILFLKQLLAATNEGQEGYGLEKVKIIRTLRSDLLFPAENQIKAKAQQIVGSFSMSSLVSNNNAQQSAGSTYAQTEMAKSRTASAMTALYYLSPVTIKTTAANFLPDLLLNSLQNYLQAAITSSLAGLARALATLPQLERTLLEISARCQNIVALEALLESSKPPAHPLLTSEDSLAVSNSIGVVIEPDTHSPTAATAPYENLLQPLLHSLDTSSLPSYFWRSLAGSLSSKVMEILNKGGVSARTLRSNKERVRDEIRQCVLRGSQLPMSTSLSRGRSVPASNWEREAAVMAGAVIGILGR